jgi:hypothetical protein
MCTVHNPAYLKGMIVHQNITALIYQTVAVPVCVGMSRRIIVLLSVMHAAMKRCVPYRLSVSVTVMISIVRDRAWMACVPRISSVQALPMGSQSVLGESDERWRSGRTSASHVRIEDYAMRAFFV